nr:MAG TPA: hypothetical protein [Caudoviricetes sp.]
MDALKPCNSIIDEMSKNVKQKLKNKKSQEQLRKEDGDEV